MSAIFNKVKATALPQSPAPHTLYLIKGGSDVRVKGYVSDANGTVFPLGIIDEQDVLSVQLDGFTVGTNTPIVSTNSIFTAFRNVQAQINTLSSAVAGGIKIPQPLDASTNPNYPPAQAGDSYIVTVAGRIGGASGPLVEVGDKIVALTANAGGNQATVGSAWFILNTNIDRATTTTFGTVRTATQQDVTGFSTQEAYVSPTTLAGGVRASLLTGFAVGTNTAIESGDSVLQAFGKVQGQLDARLINGTGGTQVRNNTQLDARYQAILTNPVTGTGTTNFLPKFTGASTIGNSAIFESGGNVGIGTASALTKLEIYDVSSSVVRVRGDVFGGAYYITNPSSNNTMFAVGDDASIIGGPAGQLITYFSGTQPHRWHINGSERMRITSGGFLLLGDTISPTESAWEGTAVFGKNGTNKVITGYLASQTNGAVIGGHNSALNEWADLNIIGGNIIFRVIETERMRITSGGNVLIGTTTELTGGGRLQVNGLITAKAGLNTPVLRLNNGGEPSFNLQSRVISNGINSNKFKHGLYHNDTENATIGYWRGGSVTGGFLTFNTNNGTERMRITSGGNVLIGTTTELTGGGSLQVNGQLNVATVNNATGDFLTHVNGIINKRTAAQVRAEIMVWTETQW